MPVAFLNRTITQAAITGAAGSIDLVSAQSGCKIYVVTLVVELETAGSLKFTEGTGPTDLTGVIELAADVPFVVAADGINPVLQTNTAGAKLSIVTVTGAPRGWLRYFVAP